MNTGTMPTDGKIRNSQIGRPITNQRFALMAVPITARCLFSTTGCCREVFTSLTVGNQGP